MVRHLESEGMFRSKERAADGECPCSPVDGTIVEIRAKSKCEPCLLSHALCSVNRNQSDASKRSVKVREKKSFCFKKTRTTHLLSIV